MNRKPIAVINILICLFLFGLVAIASQMETNHEENPVEKIDMIGPEEENSEDIIEISEEETPLAQAPEEQKEEIREPSPDPEYKLVFFMAATIMFLMILMSFFMWIFKEGKGY